MAKKTAKLLNLQTEVYYRNTFFVVATTNVDTDETYLSAFKDGDQYETTQLGELTTKEYNEIVENLKSEGKNLVKY